MEKWKLGSSPGLQIEDIGIWATDLVLRHIGGVNHELRVHRSRLTAGPGALAPLFVVFVWVSVETKRLVVLCRLLRWFGMF